MQTSAAIATAAVAQERNPVASLFVDWDADGSFGLSETFIDTFTDLFGVATDDLSARVESLTIDRQLATDLPDEVSRSAGYSSATLTATLSGDPTTEADNAASYFSPFNTASTLHGKRRRWRNCQAQIGFGSTTLPVFTGKTTGLTVDSASRTATLDALDYAETMRGVVDLPVVLADDKGTNRPGLTATWVVDYIARKCGYHLTPPARTGCVALATLAGSAYPEIGTLVQANTSSNNAALVATPAGHYGQAITTDTATWPSHPVIVIATSGTLSTNDGGEVLIEGRIGVDAAASGIGGFASVTSNWAGATPNNVVLDVNASGHLETTIRRTNGGTSTAYDSGLAVPVITSDPVYVGCHVYFTASTITIHWRVGATSASTSVATSSVTAQPALGQMTVGHGGGTGLDDGTFEMFQAGNPGTTTSAPSWNDAYAGNSVINPSLNTITAAVPTTASAWDTIQEIARAESATTGFDEFGTFFYYTRSRFWPHRVNTSVRTISASDSLTALATSETIDQLRNHIRITATTATVNAAGWVWSLADATKVPANGSTTVTADAGTPVYNLSTSIRYASTSGLSGQSQYRANRNVDGSGTAVSNLTFAVTVSAAQIAKIVVTNPNAFDVYLVSGSGFTDPAGTPSLALWGQPVAFTEAQQPDTTSTSATAASKKIIDVSDATSIAQHGDQLLEISGNPWLQDVTSLTTLANDMLTLLKDPVPILDGLTIIGDPRLQLGDRVTIVEPTLGLNGDFFLTRIMSTHDAGGYTQALTVRATS